MLTLDELFNGPTEKFEHPLLRRWQSQLAKPGMIAKLGLAQDAPGLGQADTEMFVHLIEDGQELPGQVRAWDDDLNAGLIEMGVRAVDEDQEATRFCLGLNAAFRKVTREFGDGYCNSVLVDLLTESDLAQHHGISEVMRYAHVNPIRRSTRPDGPYTTCREIIANAIGGRAKELRDRLHYSPDQVKQIMTKALALFLDQRFSVSIRRELGRL